MLQFYFVNALLNDVDIYIMALLAMTCYAVGWIMFKTAI